jgi:hypothetical protein
MGEGGQGEREEPGAALDPKPWTLYPWTHLPHSSSPLTSCLGLGSLAALACRRLARCRLSGPGDAPSLGGAG